MIKEFVTYEQALALKELGFDEPCFGYFSYEELIIEGRYKNSEHGRSISAPLYQQAFRWFREKYGVYSSIFFEDDTKYYYQFNDIDGIVTLNTGHKTYEEAEQACLDKLIEICKNK